MWGVANLQGDKDDTRISEGWSPKQISAGEGMVAKSKEDIPGSLSSTECYDQMNFCTLPCYLHSSVPLGTLVNLLHAEGAY